MTDQCRRSILRKVTVGTVVTTAGCLRLEQGSDNSSTSGLDQELNPTQEWDQSFGLRNHTTYQDSVIGYDTTDLYRLSATDGTIQWETSVDNDQQFGGSESSLRVGSDQVLTAVQGGSSGGIGIYDFQSGESEWSFQTEHDINYIGSMAESDIAYVGSSDLEESVTYVLDIEARNVESERTFSSDISSMTSVGDKIYLAADDLYKYDIVSGEFSEVDTIAILDLLEYDGTLIASGFSRFFTLEDSELIPFETSIGQQTSNIELWNGNLVVGTVSGIVMVELDDQTISWEVNTESDIVSISVSQNLLWALSDEGNLIPIDPSEGIQIGSVDLRDQFDSNDTTPDFAQSLTVSSTEDNVILSNQNKTVGMSL